MKIEMKKIYLDYNASTPIEESVIKSMLPLMYEAFGNPSSSHESSLLAKNAILKAREKIASLLNASSSNEIVFTSGGSESNNLALKGIFYASKNNGNHIITQVTEHPAILNPLKFLEKEGAKITYLPVDKFGQVDPEELKRAITSKTILISIMHANNETGTLQPVEKIGKIAKDSKIPFHCDAAQSLGKVSVDVDKLNVDLLSIAGHKMYAPKGIGALYIRKNTVIEPLIHGAGHEFNFRAGTESAYLAAALGAACDFVSDLDKNNKISLLRDYFWDKLKRLFKDKINLNGHPTERLPNTLNISFLGKNGLDILKKLCIIEASTGSACHSGSAQLSPVLKHMGFNNYRGLGAIRFSLGRFTSKDDIDKTLAQLRNIIEE
jgi:cysteine desulfurase